MPLTRRSAKVQASFRRGGKALAKAENGASISGWRLSGWGFAASLLLIPVIGMQVSDEWQWTGSDFVFAAVMIGGTGLLLEMVARASGNWAYRAGAAVALLTNFLLIWINAAVGIIGDEGDPANMMYFGVIATALAGAFLARFRPQGMAVAMGGAAVATLLVGIAALVTGLGATQPPGPLGIQILNGFFAGLWLLSAMFFRKSALGAA